MSQDKTVGAQEPIDWKDVVSAINAVAKEAASRGGMFPQEASEQREDSEAAKRVCGMIEWYSTCGGSVAMMLPDWPLYDHVAPCVRCADTKEYWQARKTWWKNKSIELKAKITEQAAEIHKLEMEDALTKDALEYYQQLSVEQATEIGQLSDHVEDAKEIIQKIMKVEKQQADRIKALEAALERERMRLAACGVVALANTPESAAKHREMLPEYESGSLESVKHIVDSEMALRDKLAKADAVIEVATQALQASVRWYPVQSTADILTPLAFAAIEAYKKGE